MVIDYVYFYLDNQTKSTTDSFSSETYNLHFAIIMYVEIMLCLIEIFLSFFTFRGRSMKYMVFRV